MFALHYNHSVFKKKPKNNSASLSSSFVSPNTRYCLRASTCPPFSLLNRPETSITTRPAPAAPAVSRCLQREKKCTCKVFTEAAILKIPQLCLTADSVKPPALYSHTSMTYQWSALLAALWAVSAPLHMSRMRIRQSCVFHSWREAAAAAALLLHFLMS